MNEFLKRLCAFAKSVRVAAGRALIGELEPPPKEIIVIDLRTVEEGGREPRVEQRPQ